MLSDRCETLWQAYLAAEKIRVRSESIAALAAFIEEIKIAPSEIRDHWAQELSRAVVDQKDETVVRVPLFREVLFPSLAKGHHNRVAGCTRWLAGFSQLLYNSPGCLAQLPESERSEHGLLLRALEVDPTDRFARERLLRILRSRFEYALHELPAGVLYGHNSATMEECDELERELRFFESLARESGAEVDNADLLEEARFHILAYREYLRTRKSGDSYEGFLASKNDQS